MDEHSQRAIKKARKEEPQDLRQYDGAQTPQTPSPLNSTPSHNSDSVAATGQLSERGQQNFDPYYHYQHMPYSHLPPLNYGYNYPQSSSNLPNYPPNYMGSYSQQQYLNPIMMPPSQQNYSTMVCKVCGQYIFPNQAVIQMQGEPFHEYCALKISQYSMSNPNRPESIDYRSEEAKELSYREEQPEEDLPPDIVVSINTQPASYQVANYNVYPCISLSFSKPLTTQLTVSANLMVSGTDMELLSGLQAGHLKKVVASASIIQFVGLKINKMGKIKNELAQRNAKHPESFYLQFRIGSRRVNTTSFKMVSSTSQLPEDVKKTVRPPPSKRDYTKETAKTEGTEKSTTTQKES